MKRKIYVDLIAPLGMVGITILSGALLMSVKVKADDSVVDNVSVTVPASCTMSGTGMNSHTAEIPNGTYQANIGTTTLHAFCNDANGFAIYAAGYTGNEIGGTNSNKLVGTAATNNATIVTGLATSTPTPDVSNWAMKLAIQSDSGNTTGTNAVTIDSDTEGSFANYHTVPNEYKKVAHKNTATDMTASTGGVKLTTTYAAYISKTQPADTYTGQVIYTLVHPSNGDAPVAPDQIGVNYMGNGLTFTGDREKNRVIYGPTCTPMYIATNPEVVETSNLTNGVQSGSYAYDEHVLQTKTFNGASKVRVVVNYGLSDEAGITVAEGAWGGWDEGDPPGKHYDIFTWELNGNTTGIETYTVDGDAATIEMRAFNVPNSDHDYANYDYGVYARFYPIYTTEQSGTEETSICSYTAQTGAYAQTTTWKGKWYINNNGELTYLENETAVIDYLENNDSLLGTSIDIYAYNPYTIHYNGNGSTAGTMTNFYTTLDTNTASSTADLMAHNFKKTGYGFAGWSADQNATVNSNSKIYGPNEKIAGNELTFDTSTHEATLYAVWVQSAGNLQNWAGCSSMQNGQVTALTDTRDNNVYTVGKLADGNCWMMENLRLDATNSSDSTKAQGFGGVFTGLASSEDTYFSAAITANSKYSSSNITGSNQGYRFPRYNNNNTNIGGTNLADVTLTVTPGIWNATAANMTDEEWDEQNNEGNNDHVQWYGYGNYYTWAAAMANTTAMNDVSTSESANTSICPTGWKLPYGRSTGNGATSGGFSYLDMQLGGTGSYQYDNDGEEIVSNRWRSYPNNFVYSGFFNNSTADDRGSGGDYWSSTAASSDSVYILYLYSGNMNSGTGYSSKSRGRSVRCLASGS